MKPPIAWQKHNDTLPLQAALLVYGGRYVTTHDIVKVPGGAPQLGPGRPLTRAELARLLVAAGRDAGLAGWVDPRVLYIGPELVVWYSPAQPRAMFFRCERDEGAGGLCDRMGTAQQPRLVWAVRGRSWFVWALRGTDDPATPSLPGRDTQLFQAPYLNVYESGVICTGDAAVPRRISTDVIDGYERAFFASRFTHPNAPNLTTYPGGIYALWNHLLDTHTPGASFPDETLMPVDTTLGDVVRRLTKNTDDDL